MTESKKKILLVEDDSALQWAIEKKLSSSNFEVVKARSVAEAEKILKAESVDAIWLDHYLSGAKSGLDYAAELKAEDSPHKNIPIFVVTNSANPEKMKAYISLGIDHYYTKTDYRLEDIIRDIQEIFQ